MCAVAFDTLRVNVFFLCFPSDLLSDENHAESGGKNGSGWSVDCSRSHFLVFSNGSTVPDRSTTGQSRSALRRDDAYIAFALGRRWSFRPSRESHARGGAGISMAHERPPVSSSISWQFTPLINLAGLCPDAGNV